MKLHLCRYCGKWVTTDELLYNYCSRSPLGVGKHIVLHEKAEQPHIPTHEERWLRGRDLYPF